MVQEIIRKTWLTPLRNKFKLNNKIHFSSMRLARIKSILFDIYKKHAQFTLLGKEQTFKNYKP